MCVHVHILTCAIKILGRLISASAVLSSASPTSKKGDSEKNHFRVRGCAGLAEVHFANFDTSSVALGGGVGVGGSRSRPETEVTRLRMPADRSMPCEGSWGRVQSPVVSVR